MVFLLDNDDIGFPDPKLGDPDGLFAVGGQISKPWLLLAYSYGIFPWFAHKVDEPHWYCPMDRFVIFPSEIHVSHSLRTLINKKLYRVSFNRDFEGVIRGCATVEGRDADLHAWLGEDMIRAYSELHTEGYAMSAEESGLPAR